MTSEELPTAWFNMEYEAQLDTTTQTGELKWSAEGLPPSLQISEAGKITGVPQETGDFDVSLTVQDGNGRPKELEVTIVVDRKRWLAYTSNEEAGRSSEDNKYQLFLVDLSKPGILPRTALLKERHARTYVTGVTFSPDGKWLAFIADTQADDQYQLFVVDVSSATPGSPVSVSGEYRVYRSLNPTLKPSWSPDSSKLVFRTETNDGQRHLRYVDVTSGEPKPSGSIDTGDRITPGFWVTNSTLAWGRPAAVYASMAGKDFGRAQAVGGTLSYPTGRAPNAQRFSFQSSGNISGCPFEMLIDVDDDIGITSDMLRSFSPDLEWFLEATDVDCIAESRMHSPLLRNVEAFVAGEAGIDLEEAAIGNTYGLSWGAQALAYSSIREEGEQLKIVSLQKETPRPELVASTGGRFGHLGFTYSDRWYFALEGEENQIFAVPLVAGVPGSPVNVTPPGTDFGEIELAPQQPWIAYGDPELLLVKLIDGKASAPRRIGPELSSESAKLALNGPVRWSTDGSWVAIVMRDDENSQQWVEALYITDVWAPDGEARRITSDYSFSCSEKPCKNIGEVVFQP